LIGTVAENVQKYGTGAINIDGCRVGFDGGTTRHNGSNAGKKRNTLHGGNFGVDKIEGGRWPANIIHDGSDEVVSLFPSEAGACAPVLGDEPSDNHKSCYHERDRVPGTFFSDSGSAARFFYCAKADRADRNDNCDGIKKKALNWSSGEQSSGTFQAEGTDRTSENSHPTVKPTDLMAYLCRLVTPPRGTVLDPYAGSGSTGKAAEIEGFNSILIEILPEYVELAKRRTAQQGLFT